MNLCDLSIIIIIIIIIQVNLMQWKKLKSMMKMLRKSYLPDLKNDFIHQEMNSCFQRFLHSCWGIVSSWGINAAKSIF